jgi:hypothetical protein
MVASHPLPLATRATNASIWALSTGGTADTPIPYTHTHTHKQPGQELARHHGIKNWQDIMAYLYTRARIGKTSWQQALCACCCCGCNTDAFAASPAPVSFSLSLSRLFAWLSSWLPQASEVSQQKVLCSSAAAVGVCRKKIPRSPCCATYWFQCVLISMCEGGCISSAQYREWQRVAEIVGSDFRCY